MSIQLPFSKRTATAVTVFTCFNVAKAAQSIDTATNVQITDLQIQYSNLTMLYRQLRQQDIPNQAVTLDSYILLAQTYIVALGVILNGMTQPNPPEYDAFLLTDYRLIVANAITTMANVVAVADDGE
jgi:multisubunit Na+/H+ antiporter MnhF subunit